MRLKQRFFQSLDRSGQDIIIKMKKFHFLREKLIYKNVGTKIPPNSTTKIRIFLFLKSFFFARFLVTPFLSSFWLNFEIRLRKTQTVLTILCNEYHRFSDSSLVQVFQMRCCFSNLLHAELRCFRNLMFLSADSESMENISAVSELISSDLLWRRVDQNWKVKCWSALSIAVLKKISSDIYTCWWEYLIALT